MLSVEMMTKEEPQSQKLDPVADLVVKEVPMAVGPDVNEAIMIQCLKKL